MRRGGMTYPPTPVQMYHGGFRPVLPAPLIWGSGAPFSSSSSFSDPWFPFSCGALLGPSPGFWGPLRRSWGFRLGSSSPIRFSRVPFDRRWALGCCFGFILMPSWGLLSLPRALPGHRRNHFRVSCWPGAMLGASRGGFEQDFEGSWPWRRKTVAIDATHCFRPVLQDARRQLKTALSAPA